MIYQFSRKPKLSYQDMVGKNELMQMHWSVKCLEEMNRFLQTAFVDCIEFICFIDFFSPDTKYPSTCCTCSLGMTSWRKEFFVMKINV